MRVGENLIDPVKLDQILIFQDLIQGRNENNMGAVVEQQVPRNTEQGGCAGGMHDKLCSLGCCD